MDSHRYCVIMAGGSTPGAYLRMTYDRFSRFMPRENILVVTLAKYAATARILHGKGTGALREEIQKYLRTVPGVVSVADEHIQFGGSGVTVVKFG